MANTELVVGDVVLLEAGDKIVADGYTIEVGWGRSWGVVRGGKQAGQQEELGGGQG